MTQPFMYEETLPYVQEAYAQRYRMIPYPVFPYAGSPRNGMPVMRPLFLEFPEDKNCYTDEHLTFLFGSSVLVANVVEKGAKTREIYLPKGSVWYDMNDHFKAYEGGQTRSPGYFGVHTYVLQGQWYLCYQRRCHTD